jgi:menaquinone-dependent protoporphyrinogen oxidase
MTEVLIVYASHHGQTAKIAARIADGLERHGVAVGLRDVAQAWDVELADYDAVVVGGSVHMSHHQRELVEWAQSHARALNARPSAFFSVSLGLVDDPDHAREAVEDFADETGWWSRSTATFAGALRYREYDPATRLFIRLLMARGHHTTDTSRNHEFTDWAAVDAFADAFAHSVTGDRALAGAPS